MTRVSPSEHSLLTLARAIMGLGQYAPVEDLLRARHTTPARLSPGALRSLRDTLAKGTVLALARCGGARQRRHLSSESSPSRLWERHGPPALRFSVLCFHTLRWLVEQPLAIFGHRPLDVDAPPTLADELFLYLCCRLVAGTPCALSIALQPQFQRSILCRLGFPDLFGASLGRVDAEGFAPLLAEGGWLLEALQDELALRWRRLEESKARLIEPKQLVDLGTAQEQVLDGFLDAVDRAGRRDLAGFVLEALRPLVDQPASRWVSNLSPRASLSVKAQARRAAGASLRALGRMARWDAEHRAVRFFDDGYEGAQLLLSAWASFGEPGFRLASDRERELTTDLAAPVETIPDTLPLPSSESAP
ncbi:hypothetical protein FJV41_18220 [Myxococcus llanfairpwllgwyngyllgogerychwyrndrobwllllantysiliogogogochensis]|uniref:FtsH ternary system domain-containing protein n=1 Tax=Myxococcus llanfairpwllgwyngyllgogerychwyrndrobwllllantysiliogogogochensis TaxID=2590453 RepID=A0A540WZS9_9BACT|nr:hypothetical protein [Myxococcus llanfairpwllgwyngyllgogerychwyrndrobwllllantysiliogogogochensis]TQF14519.1 hypothetical protein FJV41_18220 [Myxococcus llanfairpwllgwyngyllgogerychwyrndrobwllllantysiliogogogochensis]